MEYSCEFFKQFIERKKNHVWIQEKKIIGLILSLHTPQKRILWN